MRTLIIAVLTDVAGAAIGFIGGDLATRAHHVSDFEGGRGMAVGVPAGSLTFTGEENLGTYADRGTSGKAVNRRFCRNCGSPIVSLVEVMPQVHFVKAGTLDDRSWLQPTAQFWCDSAQPWVRIEGDVTKFPQNPEG